MKSTSMRNELGARAMDALNAVLHQVSTIELKEMKVTKDSGRELEMVVRIRVLGRDQTLACKIAAADDPPVIRKALREFKQRAAQDSGSPIPVFIAPYLSQETRALCTESGTGFLDLENNARLILGEVFISKRSVSKRDHQALSQTAEALRKFLPARAAAPVDAYGVPAVSAA